MPKKKPKSWKEKREDSIARRIQKQKDQLAEILSSMPIVSMACQRAGVGRTTYYRWLHEDFKFKQRIDVAMWEGIAMVNDLAESKLMNLIKAEDLRAITFWLRSRNAHYAIRQSLLIFPPFPDSGLDPKTKKVLDTAFGLFHQQALQAAKMQEELNPDQSPVQWKSDE